MEFDDLLNKHLGAFGKYQAWCTVGYIFHAVPYFLAVVEMIYQGKVPQYYCKSTYPGQLLSTKWNLTQEEIAKITSPVEEFQKQKQCHVVQRNWENITGGMVESLLKDPVDTGESLACDKHYFISPFGLTITETFDLVCNAEKWVAPIQTCFLAGMLVGVFGFGWLSDRIGRRKTMLIAQTIVIIVRIASVFVPNFVFYALLRFLNGAASFGWYTVGFVWGLELTAPKWRLIIAMSSTFPFCLTYFIVAGLTYFTLDWKLVVICDLCTFIPYLIYYCILQESPRWLYTVGRTKEADVLVRKIAAINNVQLPDKLAIIIRERQNQSNPLVLLRSSEIRKRTIANSIIWFTTALVTYGVLVNAVNLVGDPYLNMLITGGVTAFSSIIPLFTVDVRWLGRRRSILGCMFLAGVSLILMVVVPQDMLALSVALYMGGTLMIHIVFNIIYLHTPETMPTEVRNMGMSVASTVARIGGMISPYIASLGDVSYEHLPSILLGIISMVGGFAVLLLPETRGKALPDTITDIERRKVRGKVRPGINGDMDFGEQKVLGIDALTA